MPDPVNYKKNEPNGPYYLEGAENLRRVFESIQDYAIFSYSADHTITSWNPGVYRVLGYDQDEFIGQKLDMIFEQSDLDAGIPDLEIERAITQGSSVTEGMRVRKNGRLFWGSGIVRPLYNDQGEIYGFAKVLQDLSVRRQLEESLEEAKRVAEDANRAKDEFIAVLSHELRSPLTPITAAVDGLEFEVETESGKLFLDMIRRNLALELRLVDDLLDVTRIAKGKLALRMEIFDAHTIIQETAENLQQDVNQKKLNLALDFDATERHVLADPARFQQIVWNLLRNAIKFTPEGGTIKVQTINDGDLLIIRVSDTGIGMDKAGLDRIFRPFVQGMPNIARRYGGLGLGLTIARALSETFGGTLNASSKGLGEGTTFTVTLPSVEAKDIPAGNEDKTEPIHDRVKGKLLVLDDQPDARTVLKSLLELRGYRVEVCDSLRGAVDLLTKNNFDLVLSDIQLEGESGWDLPAKLPRPIPAIAVSALGTPANVETSLRAGFAAHIVKPFRIHELDRQIQEILASQHSVSA